MFDIDCTQQLNNSFTTLVKQHTQLQYTISSVIAICYVLVQILVLVKIICK